MSEYEIVFYMNDKGEKPVVEFLDSLYFSREVL